MKILITTILIGASLILYSLMLKPFTDVAGFNKKYMELKSGQSSEFFSLRESMLTQKYRIQDTGITIISVGLILIFLIKVGNGTIKSPNSKLKYILLSIALPFISVFGYIFDLIQGAQRQEFPHWADSLGIPLMSVRPMFGFLLIWSFTHLFFLKGKNEYENKISISKKFNIWLAIVILITAFLASTAAFYGQYWYAVPSAIWVYYYLSLGVVRNKNNIINEFKK